MLEIAGGIVIAFFVIYAILRIEESPAIDGYSGTRRSHYWVTTWGPRIIVFGVLAVLLVILIRLI